jgi:hypothetical protein
MAAWRAPSPSVSDGVARRGRFSSRRRIEPFDESGELSEHAGIVVVGMLTDEVDHFAIAVGSLSVVAVRLVDHTEAVPAVVHVAEADLQVACGSLGLIKLARRDELHHGIGGGIKLVLMGVFRLGHPKTRGERCRQLSDRQAMRGGLIALRSRFGWMPWWA